MTERIEAKRSEAGVALIVTMILMVLMGLIGIAAMETVTRDRQVAGFQSQNKMALYAAEAAVGDAKTRLSTDPNAYDETAVVAFPNCGAALNLGLAADYAAPLWGGGQPSYCGDNTLAAPDTPIMLVGKMDVSISADSEAPREVYWLYRIRVQGQGGGGQVQRVDTVAGAFRLE